MDIQRFRIWGLGFKASKHPDLDRICSAPTSAATQKPTHETPNNIPCCLLPVLKDLSL